MIETKEEILSTKNLGNIDYDRAIEQPVFYGNDFVEAERYKGIYNTTSGELAQIVSKYYQIIQHNDVIKAIKNVLEKKNIDVSGLSKNYGNQVQLDLTFGGKKYKIKDDSQKGLNLGIRIINSYNRASSFRLEMFGYRYICQNGMALGQAMRQVKESIFHTGQVKTYQIIESITDEFLTNVIENSEGLQKYVSSCLIDSLDWKRTAKILEALLKHPLHRKQICSLLGISIFEELDEKTGKKKFIYVLDEKERKIINRWQLYNAVTNYATNWPLGFSVEKTLQECAQKILTNKYEKLIKLEVKTK